MKEIRGNMVNVTLTERKIEGYALVFNKESEDLGGFTEIIDDSALDDVLDRSDVVCLLNHNINRGVLARSKNGKGSLSLEVDAVGLKYRFEAPKTVIGDELLESLKRGDIAGSSFAFSVKNDRWAKTSEGKYIRRILRFKEIYDVSPVYHPAYEGTTVYIDKRGLDSLLEKEKAPGSGYFEGLRSRFGLKK
jgi:HK97 family phage prohead protease